MSLTIRQAHNVLAMIAHKTPLDGDQRNVVNEANKVLVEFIGRHEPPSEEPVSGPERNGLGTRDPDIVRALERREKAKR